MSRRRGMSKPYVPKPPLLRFKNRNLHTPAALRDVSAHSRAVDHAQFHARSADRRSSATSQNTGSSRSSMKMAAGRRGWKSRQPLSQASTPSHWLARALHRWQAREDAIVSRYWLLGAWWLFDFYFNELGRLDWLPDQCKQRSRHHLLRQQPFFESLSRTFRSQTSVRCRGPQSLLPRSISHRAYRDAC